jgi:hypothetical protein
MDSTISGGFLTDITPDGIISLTALTNSNQMRLIWVLLLFIVPLIYYHHNARSRTRNLAPLINPKSPFELTNERPRKEFIANAKGIIHSWFKTHSNSPARVNGDVGQYTILPPHMIGEVDREELVSLTRWAYKVRCGCLSKNFMSRSDGC